MKNLTILTVASVVSLFTGCASQHAMEPNYPQAPRGPAYNRPAPRPNAGVPQETASHSAVGIWTGSNGAERITVKFGMNGSLILTNAAGAESGRWSGSRNSYRISVGEFTGEFVLLDASTASFTLDGSHIEMRRASR